MITIEIKDANQINDGRAEVEIYCDVEGLQELQRQIDFLIQGETHIHMATPSWAGHELGETPFGQDNTLVNQVSLVKIPA